MPLITQGKTNWKYILIVLILAIIVGGGILCYLRHFSQETILPHPILLPAHKNYIFVDHLKEGEENILSFNIVLKEYSIKSVDLSKFGLEFSQYGSQSIIPPEFTSSSKIPFLEVKSDISGEMCEPEMPYLNIKVSLPLNSEVKADLVEFSEKEIEEKLEIVPTIVCISKESVECENCPNYLKNDEFFPPEFSIYIDKSKFEEKEILSINFPLFRHNPKTRETYRIEKAKIEVKYKLPEDSSLIVEEKEIPQKIKSLEKFNLIYRIINPSLEKMEDLRLKVDFKNPQGNVVKSIFSDKFEINGDDSKEISLEAEGMEEGNYLFEVSLFKDSNLKAIGKSNYIRFVLPFEFTVLQPPSILTINDNLSAIVKNESKESAKANVYFEIIDADFINRGKIFSTPKNVAPGEQIEFKVPVAGPITNYCQKGGCTVIAYAKINTHSLKEKSLGPEYLTGIKGFLPNYCEEDFDCICCDSTEIGYPYEKNVSVNKIYSQRFNCKVDKFCQSHIGICDKKFFECKAEETIEPSECKSQAISLSTDKDVYELGEIVKIKIKNDSEKPIWILQTTPKDIRSWLTLQKFDGKEWKDLNFTFPLYEAGLGVISKYCKFVDWENFENRELKAKSELIEMFDLSKEICIWNGSQENSKPQLIQPGKYRFSVLYGCSQYFNFSKANIIYSNEFTIEGSI